MERRIRTLTCARLHMIFRFLDDESTYCMWLTQSGGSWSRDAGTVVDVPVACARVLLADGWAMNGIHSCRFDCYRIPAGALQQSHLLGCMLHAGGSGFSITIPVLLMHNVDVVWLSVLGFSLTDVFSRELIALLCCCRDLGCIATRMVEQDNSNVQGCHQWHACIQSTPQSLDLHLKHISAIVTFYRKFPVEHRASCRKLALSCRRSASSCRKTVCSCRKTVSSCRRSKA